MSAPGVLYATVLVLLTVDAFIPVVPAQALMIGGGILSTSGHVELLLLVLSGAGGVVAGDLLAFFVGRRLARRGVRGRALPRRAQAIATKLNEAMQKHIFLAVLFCRFVPAGRMITAVYAGRNGVSTRRFASYDVVAGVLWASYGALLGHFGGEAIADSSWLPLALVGAGAVLFVAGAPLLGMVGKARRRAAEQGRPPARICRRRTAMETLAAAEPMAAIEVLVAAEAVAAAEHVVVQVNGLESAAQ
ncbi:MAG TPA: DedA family protein [Dactylosporangium sp.]|nr:DedA family protein [Dactylosporangium sp.]